MHNEDNTTIPCRNKTYTTIEDYQSSILVEVYQGNRPISGENTLIGSFELDNIQLAQTGIPTIDIEFQLDMDGILSVNAIDKTTLASNAIKIRDFSSDDEAGIALKRKQAMEWRDVDQMTLKAASYWSKIYEYVVRLRRKSIQEPALKALLAKAESAVRISPKARDTEKLERLLKALSDYYTI